METLRGQIVALYLFDVAEAIDLQAAAAAISSSVRAKFAPKPATPAYVRYQEAPLLIEGAGVGVPSIDGFRAGSRYSTTASSRCGSRAISTVPGRIWRTRPTSSSKTKRSSDRPSRRAEASPSS